MQIIVLPVLMPGKNVIDSGADVILIACSSMFHPKFMKAAIDAGKHVFVEKPHGIDPAGLRLAFEAFALAKQKKTLGGVRFDEPVYSRCAGNHEAYP